MEAFEDEEIQEYERPQSEESIPTPLVPFKIPEEEQKEDSLKADNASVASSESATSHDSFESEFLFDPPDPHYHIKG